MKSLNPIFLERQKKTGTILNTTLKVITVGAFVGALYLQVCLMEEIEVSVRHTSQILEEMTMPDVD